MQAGIEEEALEAACEVAVDHGLPCGDAQIAYAGSNVLIHLRPSPVAARVMVGTVALHDDPRLWLTREVAVACFLAPAGLAVAPSSMISPGPHQFEGLWMTFSSWVEVKGPTEPRDAETLGLALRNLHEALADYPGELGGMLDLLEDIERLRQQLPSSPASESLGERLFALTDSAFDTSLPTRPLHGDASLSNLLRTPLGLLWNDFEDVLRGPVHWDVAGYVMALEGRGADEAFVRRALEAYGWDPAQDLAPFTEAHEVYGEIWQMYLRTSGR
ncbi:MAG: phosphotransferase [Solirubrobacterales bacterium]